MTPYEMGCAIGMEKAALNLSTLGAIAGGLGGAGVGGLGTYLGSRLFADKGHARNALIGALVGGAGGAGLGYGAGRYGETALKDFAKTTEGLKRTPTQPAAPKAKLPALPKLKKGVIPTPLSLLQWIRSMSSEDIAQIGKIERQRLKAEAALESGDMAAWERELKLMKEMEKSQGAQVMPL